jgi:transcriptional regulator with GAF, ATPase, and Fis domain
MKTLKYIKLPERSPTPLTKDYFTVGFGPGYDVSLESTLSSGILFSIRFENEVYTLFPGEQKILLNGKPVKGWAVLTVCDRIEWGNQVALFIDELLPVKAEEKDRKNPVQVLSEITTVIEKEGEKNSAALMLSQLLEFAGAEAGSLICEVKAGSEWSLLACQGGEGSEETQRKHLISHTILAEAIKTKKPVYIESIIGHQWEAQTSILEARLFSIACVPLLVGERVFGALFLYTRTPGRSINHASLDVLKTMATQTALLYTAYKELNELRKVNLHLKQNPSLAGGDLVFDRSNINSAMHSTVERIAKLSLHDLSILIRGETGTGKELVANEIHQRSPRASGPFVAINCAAIPPTLMESLLFGFCKGAFTGATKDQAGKFAQAHKGTLFLDEIGDLSLDLQTKLLRVLQEKLVEPVGSDKSIPVDIRVLSATHQNLEALVKEGKFRSDLFYRLNGATITVPALRERGAGEILILANHFLQNLAPHYSFSPSALSRIKSYNWPGNVRELQQAVSRAVALCDGTQIQAKDLEIEALDRHEFLEEQEIETLKDNQERFTKDYVNKVLEKCEGNRIEAATKLGISERTLYRLLASDRTSSET